MGRDKAMLPFRGSTLSQAIAREVEAAAGSVVLVGNPDLGIPDRYPGEGPLGGILTALEHSAADWNLIVACDMPSVTAQFLSLLLRTARERDADVLVPRGPSGRPEPLCAVYHRRALAGLQAHFARGTRKVTVALESLATVSLEVSEVALFQNLNTPEDWLAHAGE
jgi:molybdopterin-guanine dinucleotide biosynthesis protein A